MLIVLSGWLFALLCLLPLGMAVLRATHGRSDADAGAVAPVHVVFAGLIAATVLGNCWAFLAPIGRTFDLLLAALSIALLIAQRGTFAAHLRAWRAGVRAWSWPVLLGAAALFVIVLLKSASAGEMYDEGGYYMPYIKWIERYRIVPGIANIEDRFGFNSAFHLVSAVFGLAWLVPGGTYDLNGLLLLVFGGWCLGGVFRLIRPGRPLLSDVMKVFGLFFLMRNMLTSASADLSNILLGSSILILFAEKMEQGTLALPDQRFWSIVLYSLMVVTVKLSSLSIWLVPAYLLVRVLVAQGPVPFARLAVVGMLVIVPWLARFPVLSGYLVYPIHQVDLFHVDWKVPHAIAERQYHYVSEFAKTNAKPGESGYFAEHRGLLEWVPAWFKRENGFNKATAIALLLSILALLPFGLVHLRSLWTSHRDRLVLGAILVVNVLFWFLRNPSFRFGWAWCILLLAFTFHLALSRMAEGRMLRWASLTLLVLLSIQNTGKTLYESRQQVAAMLIRPMPMKTVGLAPVSIDGVVAQVSATNQCWGTVPPCLPVGYDRRLQARGPRVEDGFRTAP